MEEEEKSSTLDQSIDAKSLFKTDNTVQLGIMINNSSKWPVARRQTLTLKQKAQIIDIIENGMRQAEVSKKFNVPLSTVSTILKHKDKIRNAQAVCKFNYSRVRMRSAKFRDIDEAIVKWIKSDPGDVPVNGNLIKSKAEEIAQSLGHYEFRASNGWLQRFKNRHNIALKAVSNTPFICKSYSQLEIHEIMKEYDCDDVYCFGAVSLYHKLLPSEIETLDEDSVEKLSLLICTNMTATRRLPLLVVGKDNFVDLNVPVIKYEHEKNSTISETIMQSWFTQFKSFIENLSKKVILLGSTALSTSKMQCTDSVKIVLFSSDPAVYLNPIEHYIARSLRINYRESLCKIKISYPEDNITDVTCLQILNDSWNVLPSILIVNAFYSSRFYGSCKNFQPNLDCNKSDERLNDLWEVVLKLDDTITWNNFLKFVNIDEKYPAFTPETSYDRIIVTTDSEKSQNDNSKDYASLCPESMSDGMSCFNCDEVMGGECYNENEFPNQDKYDPVLAVSCIRKFLYEQTYVPEGMFRCLGILEDFIMTTNQGNQREILSESVNAPNILGPNSDP